MKSKLAAILTPVLLFVLTAAVLLLGSIYPYNKAKTLLGVLFMDTGADSGSGLEIVDTEIDTEYSGETFEEGRIDRPDFGQQYAVIECKAADIYAPVYWGSDKELLEKGACQSSSSKILGEDGNAVIDAHVDTYFANLESVEPGDEIVLYTSYGRFTYEAKEKIAFMKSDSSYVSATGKNILTLYTCRRQLLDTSDARVGVVCDLKEKAFYYEKEAE